MDNSKFPTIPKAILDEISKRFPDVMPDASDSLDQIRFQQGQISVVRFLKHQFHLQNQNILET